jgi:hypothetical protein
MIKAQNLIFLMFLFLYSSTFINSNQSFLKKKSCTSATCPASFPFYPTPHYYKFSEDFQLPYEGDGTICTKFKCVDFNIGIFHHPRGKPHYELIILKNKISFIQVQGNVLLKAHTLAQPFSGSISQNICIKFTRSKSKVEISFNGVILITYSHLNLQNMNFVSYRHLNKHHEHEREREREQPQPQGQKSFVQSQHGDSHEYHSHLLICQILNVIVTPNDPSLTCPTKYPYSPRNGVFYGGDWECFNKKWEFKKTRSWKINY